MYPVILYKAEVILSDVSLIFTVPFGMLTKQERAEKNPEVMQGNG